MATGDLLERITIDPNVCFGKPTVRGTRVWVGLILGFLADGMTIEEILAEYPSLTDDDIRACLAYGAQLSVDLHGVNLIQGLQQATRDT
jgi:uncharacterized protein (DUF433 family)